MAPGLNEKFLTGVTGRFQLESTDDIQATLQVTMRLAEWKALQKALDGEGEYGVWQFKSMVRDLIASASVSAYARIESEQR
jgi:hypothetical protein